MPVINITTMQGFITALQSIASYTTLEIMNDLDFNDVVSQITESVINIPTSYTNPTLDITINGNGHAIYNVEGGNFNPSVFRFMNCQNVVINDLSFLNCHITKSTTTLISANTSSANTIIMNNAVIQGLFYGHPLGSVTVNDSMITFSHCNGIMGYQYVQYNRCWFKFDGCTARANSGGFIRNCDQCYFTGSLGYSNMSTSTPVLNYIQNCCVNVTFNLINSTALTTSQIFANHSSGMINIVNKDKLLLVVQSTLEDTTSCKLITDEQMKDAEYLAGIGFDIIP